MKTVEVCTWDYGTGMTVVDHVWKVTGRRGARKLGKAVSKAKRWAQRAAEADHSTDHVVYVRTV